MGRLLQHAALRRNGADLGVESARTVGKCGNETGSLSWHLDVKSRCCNS